MLYVAVLRGVSDMQAVVRGRTRLAFVFQQSFEKQSFVKAPRLTQSSTMALTPLCCKPTNMLFGLSNCSWS